MGERPTLMRLPMALRPLTWLAARVYGVAVGWRNARLSKGIGVGEIRVRGVGIGVISVGNITVGGTGKSPFVAWICGEIARLGRRPVIGMRGYTPGLVRRNAGGSSMALLCDEAQEYALTAPMALVVAHPKRRRALIAELSREVHAPWIDGAVVTAFNIALLRARSTLCWWTQRGLGWTATCCPTESCVNQRAISRAPTSWC